VTGLLYSDDFAAFMEWERRQLDAWLARTLWRYQCIECGHQVIATGAQTPVHCEWDTIAVQFLSGPTPPPIF